jgi:gliding motility-associated-like protein
VVSGVLNDTNNDGSQQEGETITYSFVVTNTGNVALTNVTIMFGLSDIVITGGPINLAVGAVDATTFQGVYTLTQADIILGSISNQATASGTTPAGAVITDLSDESSILGDDPTVVTTNGCAIEVFNGMTPGGDGKNDAFYIRGIECYPNNTVQIFNRWGIVVYNQTSYNNDDKAFRGISDGSLTLSKAEELPVGTYYYVFKYIDKTAVSHEKTGYLYINK